jgi:hypothetical protein
MVNKIGCFQEYPFIPGYQKLYVGFPQVFLPVGQRYRLAADVTPFAVTLPRDADIIHYNIPEVMNSQSLISRVA